MLKKVKTIDQSKEAFPGLNIQVNGKRYAFLDSAASSQVPQETIDAMSTYLATSHANVHRGVYWASVSATDQFEAARDSVRNLLHARFREEIIFTSGATDGINLVASTWGESNLQPHDVILLTLLEHHSNVVPWQQIAKSKGARLVYVGLNADGTLNMDEFRKLVREHKPKLMAVTQMSNALGVTTPLKEIITTIHGVGGRVLVDASQGVPHIGANVKELDCDFLVFSAHKMCGPTGVGVLYAKRDLLMTMPPYRFGGDMILRVERDLSEWNELPYKFEAGTPNILGVIGFGATLKFLERLGWENIRKKEEELTQYALTRLKDIKDITIYGPATTSAQRGSVISFNIKGIHPHDVGTVVDQLGVAMRVGHHCAQPLMDALGILATVRMSLMFYNDYADIDQAISALREAQEYFHGA